MNIIEKGIVPINLHSLEKKKHRNIVISKLRCLGRKKDGLRCTRKKIMNYDFCKSHSKSLPNGRIDDGKIVDIKVSNDKQFYNSDEYVKVYKKKINHQTYLLDDENNVYINNIQSPVRVGMYDESNNSIIFLTKN